MKKITLFILLICFSLGSILAQDRPFITTWKTDNPGASDDNQITIPTFSGETYNYSVDWGDGTSDSGVTGDITHTYNAPGTYQVSISGVFPRIVYDGITYRCKLRTIDQWGDIKWSSFESAFIHSCVDVKATDVPDLGNVENMSGMFLFSGSLLGNESFKDWDTSNIKNMSSAFAFTDFNQDISSWDVSNVENMFATFIDTPFNQDISTWDVSKVTSMIQLFADTPFNQDISNWDVSNVENFVSMFENSTFSQDISNWDVSGAKNMSGMFSKTSFNHDISSWDVSKVQNMASMFSEATAFNQNLGAWDITGIRQTSQFDGLRNMFEGTSISIANYDSTLTGWSAQSLQSGITFSGGGSQYCQGEDARQKLIDDFGWNITDGGKATDCAPAQRPFITTWKTDNPGSSADNQITIPTFSGETYNYTVNWGDGASDSGVTGDITHTYDVPGTYQVSISGIFPRILMGISNDTDKLIEINQWGDIEWLSMSGAFADCTNLDVLATDIPDLSRVSSISGMFNRAKLEVSNPSFNDWDVSTITNMSGLFVESLFNENINNWDVSNVTNMNSMFAFTVFNENISDWDVSNVTDMSAMFTFSNFNQDIGNWDVSNVTDMNQMFNVSKFNQDISNWDVSMVAQFDGMFENSEFNQDIGNWNVSNITAMRGIFKDSPFDQNIGSWDVSNVLYMNGMFSGGGLSQDNYDSTLIRWSTQQLENGVTFDGGNSEFCAAEAARQKLIDDFGWTITDGGKAEDCVEPQRPFITTWKTDNQGSSTDNQITIPTFSGETYNYTVDWGDGTSDSGVTADITHTYDVRGTYQVSISGDFPRMGFSNYSDKLISINQWGDIEWSSMQAGFTGH
jgi:surface protein